MTALIWLGWAAYVAVAPPAAPVQPVVEYEARVSAYSCDDRPDNNMAPCGPFRDGTWPDDNLHGVVAAGPYEWLGRAVHIEGYGTVVIRDTPRTAWYGDVVHIDVFMAFDDAVQWGIRERKVYFER